MTTTTEKPSATAQMAGEMLDVWMSGYKTMTWSQDQMQTLAGSWMEQTRTMRQDGEKVLEVLVSQAKTNMDEMARLAEHLTMVPAWDALTRRHLDARMDGQGQ